MDDAKLIELAEDVAGLKVGMASIEDKLDDLCHKLLGNGQPGLIADLQKSDRALTRGMDKWNLDRRLGSDCGYLHHHRVSTSEVVACGIIAREVLREYLRRRNYRMNQDCPLDLFERAFFCFKRS